MAKPNWLQSLGDTMLASLTTSPTSVTGGDAYQPRAMAEFRKGDVEKAKEIQQKDDLRNLRAMAFGAAVASLPASAATIGWIPTLATEAAGWAGSIGAGYLGNKADQKLGTNWIGPTAGIVGGVLSGAGAYRGMVNAGSKGLLKGSGNMYGSRFRSDVAADMMNNSIKTVEPKTTLSTTPVIRTKVGDLEIDDPNLFYRQGTHHVGDDFLESGVVRAGTINHTPTQQTKGIVLTKRAFEQPMFSKGKLWYGIDDSRYPDVLVASPSTKMQMATAHANPTTNVTKAGIRRIPEGTLTNKEVRLYRRIPGYGYKEFTKPQLQSITDYMQSPWVTQKRTDSLFSNGSWNGSALSEAINGGIISARNFMNSKTYKNSVLHDIALAKRAFGYDINPVMDARYVEMPVKTEVANLGKRVNGVTIMDPMTNNPADDLIQWNYNNHQNVNDLAGTMFHETIHHGRYKTIDPNGNTIMTTVNNPKKIEPTLNFYRWKLKHLFKPEIEIPDNLKDHYKYLTSVEVPHNEGATNVLELGFLGGFREKNGYPGAVELQRMLDEVKAANPAHRYTIDLLNMKKPKRVWMALTGQYEDGGKLADSDYVERIKNFLKWRTMDPKELAYINNF